MLLRLISEFSNSQIFIGLGILILVGYIIGKYSSNLKIPKVTGYIVAGIVLGPSVLNIFSLKTLEYLNFIPFLTLGVIALIMGAGLSFDLLKHIRLQLLSITFFQAFGALFFTLIILIITGLSYGAAIPLAAIACATAPAATVAVIKEFRAYGSFTNMVLGVVVLDDVLALLIFSFILSFDLQNVSTFGTGVIGMFHLFLFEVFNSVVIGALLGILTHMLFNRAKYLDNVIILFGMVFLGIGLSNIMQVSYLLTNMIFGFVLTNISSRNKKSIQELEKFTPPIYCLFFVLAGTHLDIGIFKKLGGLMAIWAALLILFRFFGKVTGSYFGALISNAPIKIRHYLGFALIPQAGLAIGLTMLITEGSYYYEFKPIILTLTLAAVAVNELIGPLMTKYALVKAEEAIIKAD